ncbi:MAG: ABC transporter permease, partial [Chloroflexota bacterium]
DYVLAARSLGASDAGIVRRHVVPNVAAPLIVQTSLSLTTALLTTAALSFLGLGIQPPEPSWGGMISRAESVMLEAPWLAIFPGLAIMFDVIAFNFLGDGLRDALDPSIAGRKMEVNG